jgi:ABC-type transport system involved in cytochrome c biogenesis permease subunit
MVDSSAGQRTAMLEFVSRISVVCFVASYVVALACEASRLLFRSGVRGAVMVGFAAAGLVAHTAFLLWRAASEAAVPLSSPFDWYLLAAWVLAAGSLALTLANPRIPIGLFTLPVVLALIGAATLSSRAAFPQSPATQVWGVIHGSFNLAASLAVAAGAIAAVMWLFQAGRLARKEPPKRGFRMPSLERLSHTTMHAMTVAAWTAAAGFTSGLILNAVNKQRGLLETVPWTDPVVLRMAMLVSWLMVAAVIARTVKQRPGGARMIVWLSLVSFFVLTGSIVWGLFGATRHGVPPTPPSAINEVAS